MKAARYKRFGDHNEIEIEEVKNQRSALKKSS